MLQWQLLYFRTELRKEETSFYSTCSITWKWDYLLICDVKPCQIVSSITEEVQKSISRSSYNFWYRFVAVFLRNDKTTGKEEQENNVGREIKGSEATIVNASVLINQFKLKVFMCIGSKMNLSNHHFHRAVFSDCFSLTELLKYSNIWPMWMWTANQPSEQPWSQRCKNSQAHLRKIKPHSLGTCLLSPLAWLNYLHYNSHVTDRGTQTNWDVEAIKAIIPSRRRNGCRKKCQ